MIQNAFAKLVYLFNFPLKVKYQALAHYPYILGWPKKTKFLIFSKNMKYVSYMNYLRPMMILESLKTPHRLCTIDLNFTKDFSPKYKGNICILVFWRFTIIFFLWNDFKSLRSFCLIDTLLLIPILP